MPTSGLYTQFSADFRVLDGPEEDEPLPLPIIFYSRSYEKMLKAKAKIRMMGALTGGFGSVAKKATLKGDTLTTFSEKVGPLFGFDHTKWVEVETTTKTWIEEQENGDKKHITVTTGKYQTNRVYIYHFADLYEPRLKPIEGRPDLDFSEQRKKLEDDEQWENCIRQYPFSKETLREMHNKMLEAKLRQELPEDPSGAPYKRMMKLMYQGVHGTWEMAVERSHHAEILRSGELVKSLGHIIVEQTHPTLLIPACAAVWTLAVNRKARAMLREDPDPSKPKSPAEENSATEAPPPQPPKAGADPTLDMDDEEEVKEVPNAFMEGLHKAMNLGLDIQQELAVMKGLAKKPAGKKGDEEEEEEEEDEKKKPPTKDELRAMKDEGKTEENAELLQWMSVGAMSLMVVDSLSRHALALLDPGLLTLIEYTKRRDGDSMYQEFADRRRLYSMKVVLMLLQRSKENRLLFAQAGGPEICMDIMEDQTDISRLRFVAACCLATFPTDPDALKLMLKNGKAMKMMASGKNTIHNGLIMMRKRSVERETYRERKGSYPPRLQTEVDEVAIMEAAGVAMWGAAYAICVLSQEMDEFDESVLFGEIDYWAYTTINLLAQIKNFYGCLGLCTAGTLALFARRPETCSLLYETIGKSVDAAEPWLNSTFGFRISTITTLLSQPPHYPLTKEEDELYDPNAEYFVDTVRSTIAGAIAWMTLHNQESRGSECFYGPFRYKLRQPFSNLVLPWFVGYDAPELPPNMHRSLYRSLQIRSSDMMEHKKLMEAVAGALMYLATEGEEGTPVHIWDDVDFDDHLNEMELSLEFDAAGAAQNFVAGMWVALRNDDNRRNFLRLTPGWSDYEEGIADEEPEPEPAPEPTEIKSDDEEGGEGEDDAGLDDVEGIEAQVEDAQDDVAAVDEANEEATGEAPAEEEEQAEEIVEAGPQRKVLDSFRSFVNCGKGWLTTYLETPAHVDDHFEMLGYDSAVLRHMSYWCAMLWLVLVPPDAERFVKEEIYKLDKSRSVAPQSWWTTISPQVGHGDEWGPGTDEALEVLVTVIVAPWKECHRRTKMIALGCAWSFAAINPSGAMCMADLGILDGLMNICQDENACTAAREYSGHILMMLVENRERMLMAGHYKLAKAYVSLIDTAKPCLQACGTKGMQLLVNRDADLDNVDEETSQNADDRKKHAAKAGAVRSLVALMQRLTRRQTAAVIGKGMNIPDGISFGFPPEAEHEGDGGDDGIDERPGAPGAPAYMDADEATQRVMSEFGHLRHIGDEECALRCARSLLNLSHDPDNQVAICKRGLYTLLRAQCLYRLVDYEIVEAISGCLGNLSCNYRNRTMLYKAELRGTKAMQERKIAAGEVWSKPIPVTERGAGPKLPPHQSAVKHQDTVRQITDIRNVSVSLPPLRAPKASFDPLEGPMPLGDTSKSKKTSKSVVANKPTRHSGTSKDSFVDWAKGIFDDKNNSTKSLPKYMEDAARSKEELESQRSDVKIEDRDHLPRLPPSLCRPLREMWEPCLEKIKREGGMRWRPDVLEYRQEALPNAGGEAPIMPQVAGLLLSAPRPADAKRILGTALQQLCATGHIEEEIWREPGVDWDRPTVEELYEQGVTSDVHESLPVTVMMPQPAKALPDGEGDSQSNIEDAGSLPTVPETSEISGSVVVHTSGKKTQRFLTLGESRAQTPLKVAKDETEPSPRATNGEMNTIADVAGSSGLGLKVVIAPKKGRTCIAFRAGLRDMSSSGPRPPMLALFEHVPGSRYWQDTGLDAHYLLPNGRETHYYYNSGDLTDEVGDELEAFPPRPTSLDLIMQLTLAPPDSIVELTEPKGGLQPTKYRPQPGLAPKPKEHTLPVKEPENLEDGFGDMDDEISPDFAVEPYIVYEERSVEKMRLEKKIIPKNRPPWRIEASVFWPRRKECDAKTLWNTSRVQQKAAECDIKRLQEKEKFVTMLEKEGKNSPLGDKCVKKVFDMLAENHHIFMNMMVYYNSQDPTSSSWHMGLNVWTRLLEDCKVPEHDSEFCKRSDLDTIHIVSNYTADKKSELYKVNSENGFLRFELLEAIFRTAMQKYTKGENARTKAPEEALRILLEENIFPNLPSRCQEPSNKFRSERLYCEDMDLLYVKYLDILRALYSNYRLAPKGGGLRLKKWDIRSWDMMVDQATLIDPFFTIAQSRQCYMYARMLTIDEVGSVERYRGFTFIDLLEGIGRIADEMSPPSMVDLENAGFTNPFDWLRSFEDETMNPIPRRESMEYSVPPTRPLHVKTETLLDLMFRRLDYRFRQGVEYSRDQFLKAIKREDKERGT